LCPGLSDYVRKADLAALSFPMTCHSTPETRHTLHSHQHNSFLHRSFSQNPLCTTSQQYRSRSTYNLGLRPWTQSLLYSSSYICSLSSLNSTSGNPPSQHTPNQSHPAFRRPVERIHYPTCISQDTVALQILPSFLPSYMHLNS